MSLLTLSFFWKWPKLTVSHAALNPGCQHLQNHLLIHTQIRFWFLFYLAAQSANQHGNMWSFCHFVYIRFPLWRVHCSVWHHNLTKISDASLFSNLAVCACFKLYRRTSEAILLMFVIKHLQKNFKKDFKTPVMLLAISCGVCDLLPVHTLDGNGWK